MIYHERFRALKSIQGRIRDDAISGGPIVVTLSELEGGRRPTFGSMLSGQHTGDGV